MGAQALLHTIAERLHSTATVKSVFGDPIQAHGRIVVPIARVAYGFGAGFGSGPSSHGEHTRNLGEGGGGGGGVRAIPAGALEITASKTRFIPFHDYSWMAAALGVGILAGAALARRKLIS